MARFWKIGLIASLGSGFFACTLPAAAEPMGSENAPAIAPLPDIWQGASPQEVDEIWGYILNSPLGIAALNQLAIEGFINPLCERTFYTHTEFGTFQTLMQVECPEPQGASIAIAYDEIRVTFNRFEDNIENFDIERISSEN